MDKKLVQVERGNVVLRVPDYDVQRYIDQGYNLIDEHGNVMQASVPRDLGTLRKAYVQHTEEIKSLKKDIQKLRQELANKTNSRRKKTEQ